jgi:hypothetical protein
MVQTPKFKLYKNKSLLKEYEAFNLNANPGEDGDIGIFLQRVSYMMKPCGNFFCQVGASGEKSNIQQGQKQFNDHSLCIRESSVSWRRKRKSFKSVSIFIS